MDQDLPCVFAPRPKNIVYRVSPDLIAPSQGRNSLLHHFALHGVHMRAEHFVCSNFQNGSCSAGSDCPDIHITVDVSSGAVRSNEFHRNPTACGDAPSSEAAKANRPVFHEPGTKLTVYMQHGLPHHEVDSSAALVTRGSELYVQATQRGQTHPRMHQCAHFQRKHCVLGPKCNFMHVVGLPPDAQQPQLPALQVPVAAAPVGTIPLCTVGGAYAVAAAPQSPLVHVVSPTLAPAVQYVAAQPHPPAPATHKFVYYASAGTHDRAATPLPVAATAVPYGTIGVPAAASSTGAYIMYPAGMEHSAMAQPIAVQQPPSAGVFFIQPPGDSYDSLSS